MYTWRHANTWTENTGAQTQKFIFLIIFQKMMIIHVIKKWQKKETIVHTVPMIL